MTEDIIIQSEPEKQDKNQILGKSFDLSDFDLKISDASDFEIKFLRRVRFRRENFF